MPEWREFSNEEFNSAGRRQSGWIQGLTGGDVGGSVDEERVGTRARDEHANKAVQPLRFIRLSKEKNSILEYCSTY